MKTPICRLLAACGYAACLAGAAAADLTSGLPGYSSDVGTDEARFGARLGAGSHWESGQSGQSAQPGLPGGAAADGISFGGGPRLSCTGIDLNGFLHSFDPAELLGELRNALLTGAQAAAANYLLTLAYANPTITSILDMLDKRYSARFSAFAQACNAQADRARGLDAGARTMADAGDQCFGQEVAHGTAPTEAYRRCSVLHSFAALDIPAAASLGDFLRKYTSINVTKEFEALLALLPDERVDQGSYQIRPAQMTVASMSERLRGQARLALDRIDAGISAATIPPCSADAVLGRINPADGCLPAGAAALVTSGAFQSARLLGTAARGLFKDALSAQIALSAMYSNLLDLYQQTARIDVRGGSNADAAHARARRRQLQEAIGDLLREADTQVKAQDARAQVVRSQMLALEQVESELDARSRVSESEPSVPQFGLRDLLRLFSGRP